MENFKDLPLWRQVYKIGFPEQYDENDTYEQAEYKKAYNMRDLNSGLVTTSLVPKSEGILQLGSPTKGFNLAYIRRMFNYVGNAAYTYDNIINSDEKSNIIKNLEFTYYILSSKYVSRSAAKIFDDLGIYRGGNYADYIALLSLKIDNLNRRIKMLEVNK